MFVNKKNGHSSKKQKCRVSKSHKILLEIDNDEDIAECKFDLLNADSLEHIASFLQTNSALALYRSSSNIMKKLESCSGFWKSLCKMENFHSYSALKHDDEDGLQKLSWMGETFHDVDIPEKATFWHKIFIRGLQMRRNICSGNFEFWRLFMMDKESLPVKKMMNTTSRELRTSHRKSHFNDPKRRIGTRHFWTNEYFIAIQQKVVLDHSSCVNDIFVWKWKDCRNPEFLYIHDLLPLYATFTAFFVHKNFLILMPENAHLREGEEVRSMICVHDLSNNMDLVGGYDFPENGYRRHVRFFESSYLQNVGDHAVALCRTPTFMFFIFSLPNCELVHTVPVLNNPERPLELDDLDDYFMTEDNTMMFRFRNPKYRRMLFVDIEMFLKSGEPLVQRLDPSFDCNKDSVEALSMISKTHMVCLTASGRVSLREIISINASTSSFIEQLSIPCPEAIKEDYGIGMLNLCISSSNDIILIFRHFKSGRKIHGYDKQGSLLYTIDIDAPQLGLETQISIDMDGQFVCAADQNKIVLWNSKTGKFINAIPIPAHFNDKEDDPRWHTRRLRPDANFCFAEDGIIVTHNKRNFPIAADLMLFW